MRVVSAPKDFIVKAKMHKVLTIILHTMQMTQAMSLLETKPKIVFDIGCDHLSPSMAMVLFIHALHLQKHVKSWRASVVIQTKHPHQNQLARFDFLKRCLVII
jgi:hypothetical protein